MYCIHGKLCLYSMSLPTGHTIKHTYYFSDKSKCPLRNDLPRLLITQLSPVPSSLPGPPHRTSPPPQQLPIFGLSPSEAASSSRMSTGCAPWFKSCSILSYVPSAASIPE